MKAWYESIPYYPYSDHDSWVDHLFELRALNGGPAIYRQDFMGALDLTSTQLQQTLEDLGARLYTVSDDDLGHGRFDYKFSWPNAVARYYAYSGSDPVFCLISEDLELFEKIKAYVKAHVLQRPKGSVYVLKSTDGDVVPTTVGRAGLELERDNYTPEVLSGFDHVVEDLGNLNPCGRLILMDGPPGVGKTHLIRALFNKVDSAMFLLVPAGMVETLGQPSLMSTLLDLRSENKKTNTSTVFVIEDADTCLVPRAKDNVDAVSSLLNLSDGILGAMVDIRIVCTTNAKEEQVDLAIMRPGRLCRRIEVGMLDQNQAAVVYARLNSPPITFPKGFYTLAEIYRSAKEGGWHDGIKTGRPPSTNRKVGFGS